MKIHQCARCEGCGYITGAYRWEIPWSRCVPSSARGQNESVLEAHACPDCGGTGALIELDGERSRELPLASRRGLPREGDYVRHVASVLQHQSGRRYQH